MIIEAVLSRLSSYDNRMKGLENEF